jgi:hypothetical protein
MRYKGGNPAEWTERTCSQMLGLSVAETSALIASELSAYLDSWQGSEQDKWNGCYVALRERVKQRLTARGLEHAVLLPKQKADCRCFDPDGVTGGSPSHQGNYYRTM